MKAWDDARWQELEDKVQWDKDQEKECKLARYREEMAEALGCDVEDLWDEYPQE